MSCCIFKIILCNKLTGCRIIRNLNNKVVNGAIVCDTWGRTLNLNDIIFIFANLIEYQNIIIGGRSRIDIFEINIAVGIIGAYQHGIGCAILINIKCELASLKSFVFKLLLNSHIQIYGNILRIIGIYKGYFSAVTGYACALTRYSCTILCNNGHGRG